MSNSLVRPVDDSVVGAGIAYGITVLVPSNGSEALWFVYLSGCLAITALILPGISGSFILLLLGMYTFVIPTVKTFLKTGSINSKLLNSHYYQKRYIIYTF